MPLIMKRLVWVFAFAISGFLGLMSTCSQVPVLSLNGRVWRLAPRSRLLLETARQIKTFG